MSIDELSALQWCEAEILASICKDSFEEFVRNFWPYVPGAGETCQWNWHMSFICSELQTIAERVFASQPKEYDLLINISPGTSKSTLCSILFPAWTWTRMPHARHIIASHTDMLVLDLASKSRAVIESELYRELFPYIVMRKDQDTKGYFANTLGGDRVSCTVGGKSPVGFHGHFLSWDDPIDPQKAMSEVEIQNASDFAPRVLFTRKVDKAVSVFYGIMQRLHPNDPSGALLRHVRDSEDADPIRHICLPAELAENVNPPELRGNYIDGLMDPIRLGHKVLRPYRANAYSYAGQFQQSPTPLGGGMFKVTYFNKRVKAAPFDCRRVRFWDRAATQDGGCYTAGTLEGRDKNDSYYVEHVVHGQWEPTERNQIMRATALRDRAKYGPNYEPVILVEAEGGSSGRDAWLGVVKALQGFHVKEIKVTGQKDTRAEPWSTQLAAGNVYLVDDGTWDINSYVEEHTMFRPVPGKRLGKYKDQVDSSSGAFNYLSKVKMSVEFRVISFGKSKQAPLRIVVCSHDELRDVVIDDHRCLLITMYDPTAEIPVKVVEAFVNGMGDDMPVHGLKNMLGYLPVWFANIEPIHYQDKWQEVVPEYGKTPDQLIMTPELGKKLWAFILKRRDPAADVFVLCDNGDSRALSVAYALCDMMRLERNKAIYCMADPDSIHEGKEAPNQHVYSIMKASRGMVM